MSRWAKLDVPSLKLASQLDTDHWAKLKGKVSIKYQNIFFLSFSKYTIVLLHSQAPCFIMISW